MFATDRRNCYTSRNPHCLEECVYINTEYSRQKIRRVRYTHVRSGHIRKGLVYSVRVVRLTCQLVRYNDLNAQLVLYDTVRRNMRNNMRPDNAIISPHSD